MKSSTREKLDNLFADLVIAFFGALVLGFSYLLFILPDHLRLTIHWIP